MRRPSVESEPGTPGLVPNLEKSCSHYDKKCSNFQFDCCNVLDPCHRCHMARESCDVKPPAVSSIMCNICLTRQSPSDTCIQCSTKFSHSYCGLCKIWTAVDISHCVGCGFCRVGKPDEIFHCSNCEACFSKETQGSHVCAKTKLKGECCPLCLESVHFSTKASTILNCGHVVHSDCWKSLFAQVCPHVLPPTYNTVRSTIYPTIANYVISLLGIGRLPLPYLQEVTLRHATILERNQARNRYAGIKILFIALLQDSSSVICGFCLVLQPIPDGFFPIRPGDTVHSPLGPFLVHSVAPAVSTTTTTTTAGASASVLAPATTTGPAHAHASDTASDGWRSVLPQEEGEEVGTSTGSDTDTGSIQQLQMYTGELSQWVLEGGRPARATFCESALRRDNTVDITCYDCEQRSTTAFHFLGLECRCCGGFNTGKM